MEAKWKELEDRAREEMEELLRMEGFDPKEWVSGREMSGRMEKKGKKGKKKGKRQAKEAAATVLNTVHREFQCDRCRNGKEIEGIRYSCKVGVRNRADLGIGMRGF